MRRIGNIVTYTDKEIDEMIARGEDQTDWEHVDATTEEELETSIDYEDEGVFDWSKATPGFPQPKRQLTVRFDGDIVDWFKTRAAATRRR